jgi:hypothetical protein
MQEIAQLVAVGISAAPIGGNVGDKRKAPPPSSVSSSSAAKVKAPAAKVPKTEAKKSEWLLGAKKYVSAQAWKGRTMIHIRERYEDKNTGELKPGKKGIALSIEQWKELVRVMPEVDAVCPAQ